MFSVCDALEITRVQLLTVKGIYTEYKDSAIDYEVIWADIKIIKQIHGLDEQTDSIYEALQKLEAMESIVEEYILDKCSNKCHYEKSSGFASGRDGYMLVQMDEIFVAFDKKKLLNDDTS